MAIKVLYFGVITELTQISKAEFDPIAIGFKTSEELLKFLHQKYPLLHHYKFSVAVNGKFITDDVALNDNDELALMPPFAGG